MSSTWQQQQGKQGKTPLQVCDYLPSNLQITEMSLLENPHYSHKENLPLSHLCCFTLNHTKPPWSHLSVCFYMAWSHSRFRGVKAPWPYVWPFYTEQQRGLKAQYCHLEQADLMFFSSLLYFCLFFNLWLKCHNQFETSKCLHIQIRQEVAY